MDKHDTLLLAGGSKEHRAAMRAILSEHYNLLEAAGSSQTLRLLEQNFDCIAAVLLDITGPGALERNDTSWEGLAPFLKEIPLIAISPDDSPEILSRAFDFGASDVIPVDYDGDAMRQRIDNIVERLDGYLSRNSEDGAFTTEILLPQVCHSSPNLNHSSPK